MMVKYFCDMCGVEVPKQSVVQFSVYVRGFKASLKEIELSHCPGCFCKVIGEENAEKYSKLVAEREAVRRRE